jgi:hypothetical protein
MVATLARKNGSGRSQGQSHDGGAAEQEEEELSESDAPGMLALGPPKVPQRREGAPARGGPAGQVEEEGDGDPGCHK